VSFHPQAAAQAEDASDLSGRLEACGQLVRPDPAAEPAMYRCATMSQAELRSLRMKSGLTRMFANAEPAVAKLETLQAQAEQAGRATRRPSLS